MHEVGKLETFGQSIIKVNQGKIIMNETVKKKPCSNWPSKVKVNVCRKLNRGK
jgi:hypothetical protein